MDRLQKEYILSKVDDDSMSEDNKALVRKIYDRIWYKGDMSAVDELFDAGYIDHIIPPGTAPGLEGFKAVITQIRTAFPDMTYKLEDIIAEGDKVVSYWTNSGTNTGELNGMPPTGKKVEMEGVDIYRIANGKVVEVWGVHDVTEVLWAYIVSVMQQFGVVQPPTEAT